MTERQDESEHAQRMLVQTTMRLVDEIQAHRALAAAETGELQVQPQSVAALELVHNIANAYSGYIVGRMREIEIVVDPASEDVMLESDAQLLERVLGNMVKNALEASKDGQKVTIGCYGADGHVYFTVHNESEIPPDVQAQIFQRAFSTKDIRRGLGTYSMKLLTERYLNGKVSFCSNKDHGTTFRVMYPVVLAAPQARGAA